MAGEIIKAPPKLSSEILLTADFEKLNFTVRDFLKSKNENSRAAAINDLRDFGNYLGLLPIESIYFLIRQDGPAANEIVLKYKWHLLDRKLKSSTVNRRLSTLKNFIKICRVIGLINYEIEIKSEKIINGEMRGPSINFFRLKFEKIININTKKAARDLAIFRLAFDLALRRNEIAGIDFEDLDFENEAIKIKGKGRQDKTSIFIPEKTRAAVNSWLGFRGRDPGPLFFNFDHAGKNPGGRITGAAIWYLTKKYFNCRPHGIRHLAITQGLDLSGGDLRSVRQFSRHRNLNTVQIYDDSRANLGAEISRKVSDSL